MKSLFINVPIQCSLDCLEISLRKFHYSATEIDEILNFAILCARQTVLAFIAVFYSQIESLSLDNFSFCCATIT